MAKPTVKRNEQKGWRPVTFQALKERQYQIWTSAVAKNKTVKAIAPDLAGA